MTLYTMVIDDADENADESTPWTAYLYADPTDETPIGAGIGGTAIEAARSCLDDAAGAEWRAQLIREGQ